MQYRYFAGKTLDLGKNLSVRKGEPLPERWQESRLVKWLKEKHGEDAVTARPKLIERKEESRPREARR